MESGSVLGHDDVMRRFLQAMAGGRLHHAWLLCGPQGTGKAMLARVMARAYLCERNRAGAGATPACGTCHGCRMVDEGAHPDFLYVEREPDKQGRKKRDVSVDQVRRLMTFLSLSGAESERRVVLLDEAAMLNQHAANALLKGLEEPAAGSLLLLVCDDMSRLPATVRSRCTLERISLLDDALCHKALEGMGLSGEALELGLALAAGRPGSVACLCDPDITAALLEWRRLTIDMAASDIGAIQSWLGKHVTRVPHPLLVRIVLSPVCALMQQVNAFPAQEALMQACWALATWPERVVRHSLRPGPSLLAQLLALRVALREIQHAASTREVHA